MDGGDLRSADDSSEPLATGGDVAAVAAGAEESEQPREGCEALARAISSTLGSVIREFDARAEGVARSQDELFLSLDRLTGELDKLLEDAPLPFIVQHVTKISSIRKRVSALNLLLKSIQRRIDNIDRMLSTGVPNDNVPIDIAETSSLTLFRAHGIRAPILKFQTDPIDFHLYVLPYDKQSIFQDDGKIVEIDGDLSHAAVAETS